MKTHSHLLTPDSTKELLLAGKALFTVKSLKKDLRYTFKVVQAQKTVDGEKIPIDGLYLCSVLVGPDNWTNYKYFGLLKVNADGSKKLLKAKKGKVSFDAPSVQFFALFLNELYKDNLEGRVEIWHEGKCLRCGKRLTTPESIERGIGPECWKAMGKVAPKTQLEMSL